MSSGKKIVINTQERAISTDINRLQSFREFDALELQRFMLDVYSSDDLDAGAVVTEPNTVETPLRAEVVNGLLVRPQPTSLNLNIDPGVLLAINPDSAPDESNYKQVRDAGGAVVMTANASGSIRIDVVECRINPTNAVISDNRDIFNPSTGLFTATSVPKEVSTQLEYRVRAGTPGAGFPGSVSGWLPLCVASVPNGTVSVDTVTFWDVRPLLSDRAYQPFGLGRARPRIVESMVNATTLATTTGLIDAVNVPVAGISRRLGGRLRSGSVVADAESIDVSAAANRDGTVFVANRPWYMYLMTPFGLPRWARYNAAGSRVPRSPRGIPVVSQTSCDADGKPLAAISLPTITGLGTNTSDATCVACGYVDNGGAQRGFFGDAESGYLLSTTNALGGADPLKITDPGVVSAGAAISTATFSQGIHYPPHARAIYVDMEFGADLTTGTNDVQPRLSMRIYAPSGGAQNTNIQLDAQYHYTNSAFIRMGWAGWIVLPTIYPATAVTTQRVDFHMVSGINPVTATGGIQLRVLGWKF